MCSRRSIHKSSLASNKVNKVKAPPKKKSSFKVCRYCGLEHEWIKEKCPAWGKECSKCKWKNHFARCCNYKNKEKQKVHKVKDDESASDDDDGSSDWVMLLEIRTMTEI